MKKTKILLISICITIIWSFICYFVVTYFLDNIIGKQNDNEQAAIYNSSRASTIIESDKDTEDREVEEFQNGYYIYEKDIKLPVLIYHAIDDKIPASDKWNIYVTTDTFEENINTLLNEGYTFITFDDLYKYKKGTKKLAEKNIIMTIDDGYANNYTKAYPILKKYNVKANIFLITDYRGDDYMTWDQIKEMYNGGLVKFYSHGRDHIDYTEISTSKLKQDILASHKAIEENLGGEVLKVFAYPSGAHNKETVNALKSVGFEIQVMTKYGTVNKSKTLDLTDIGRIRVEDSTTGKQIINIINKASN